MFHFFKAIFDTSFRASRPFSGYAKAHNCYHRCLWFISEHHIWGTRVRLIGMEDWGCLPSTWANRSVHGVGKWFAKFRTGKFRPGIAFTICTNHLTFRMLVKMNFQKWSIWSDNLSCHNLYTLTVTWKCMLTSIRNVKFLWKCESSQCWAPLFVFYFLLICHYYPAPSLLLSSFKSLLAGWILITNLSSSHPVITPTLPQDWSGIHLSLCARH